MITLFAIILSEKNMANLEGMGDFRVSEKFLTPLCPVLESEFLHSYYFSAAF
jgi:hypothetical protein